MEHDCNLVKHNDWFRYRAAAIIVENNCILFVKNDVDDYYYSVGGGVHIGEKAEDAVRREVLEETGIAYEVDRLAFIHENFFVGSGSLEGYKCHELALYYLMKPRGEQKLDCDSISSLGIREHMHWIPIDELEKHIAYPSFLADKVRNMSDRIEHIVTYE